MRLQSRTKRGHSRYPINAKFEGNELSSYHTKKKPVTFRRQVKDISDGGFSACLRITRPSNPHFFKASSGSLRCLHRSPPSFKFAGLDRYKARDAVTAEIGLQYAI